MGYLRQEVMELVKQYKEWTLLHRNVEESIAKKMAVVLTRACEHSIESRKRSYHI